MQSDVVMVEILNWERYNPKRDQSSYSWLRLNNDIATDPDLFGLTAEQKFVWVCILCQASRDNKSIIRVNVAFIEHLTGVNRDAIEATLEFLEQKPVIRIQEVARPPATAGDRARPRVVASATPTNVRDERTYERTNVCTEPIKKIPKKRNPKPQQSDAVASSPVTQLKESFFEAYRNEFGREYPGWGAKENVQAAAWLRSVSFDKARELSKLFVQWNDPWVTQRGHAFGILVTQYVQLDAWAKSSTHLIRKIAQGKAAEKVDLQRAIDLEEMKRGVESRQAAQDLSLGQSVQRQLSVASSEGVSRDGSDPFSAEIYEPPSEDGYATGS